MDQTYAETRARSDHPAGSRAVYPGVLIVADEPGARAQLELLLPAPYSARCVPSASDTEGLDTDVVVIGGSFPLVELAEVRAHPQLFDKPVILFAPGRMLPDLDWRSLNVRPVTGQQGAADELVGHVNQLLSRTAQLT